VGSLLTLFGQARLGYGFCVSRPTLRSRRLRALASVAVLVLTFEQRSFAQTVAATDSAGAAPVVTRATADPTALPEITVQAPKTSTKKRAQAKPASTAALSKRILTSSSPTPPTTGSAGAPNVGTGPVGPPNMASQLTISGEELNARPVTRPGEILEAVPGLIVTQHSGEGKANQYFLRGYNLDHGTDLAISVDDVPINLRTHAHGQGYSDLNWLMPETVNTVDVRKGPYYAMKAISARQAIFISV
jgi:outer membrane receptor for Fe3+-dicitrate